MSESFAELFEESLKTLNLQAGSIITGVIVDIDYQARWVTVHAGLKSEALIPLEQFYNDAGELSINVGDEVHVALDSVCLLYTSPSPRDRQKSRMPSSA